MYHGCEADVVRAASFHLLNPVHQALGPSPYIGQNIEVCAEVQQNRLRTDVLYYKLNANGRHIAPFAIIEFKRRGILRQDQFMKACRVIRPASRAADIAAFKRQAELNDDEEETLFSGNSRKGMKQISAYAVEHRTKYCALFDCDASGACQIR